MTTVGRGQGVLATRESIPRFASADHMPQISNHLQSQNSKWGVNNIRNAKALPGQKANDL